MTDHEKLLVACNFSGDSKPHHGDVTTVQEVISMLYQFRETPPASARPAGHLDNAD